MQSNHEFAFQLSLNAIARVRAGSEEEARDRLNSIDCIDPAELEISGLNGRLTEFSIAHDPAKAELLEIDGDEPCRECGEPNPDGGDGWNGYCPTCADRASAIQDAEDDGWSFVETPAGWYAERDGNETPAFSEKVDAARFIEDAGELLNLPQPGRPNVVYLNHARKALFVHGCFWHGHDCARGARVPKKNRDYWVAKIERNRRRDDANLRAMEEKGWRTLVLWECELKDEDALRGRLIDFLGRSSSSALGASPSPPL